jgi:type VI secretion system protein ImpK
MVVGMKKKASGPQPDATQTDALDVLVYQAMLSKAASLARYGEYAAAQGLLRELVRGENENPIALDLLARIHAQQGRFSEAQACWKRALQLEPNDESYLAGLRRIAQWRSRPLWAGALLPMSAGVLAILAVLLVGSAVRDQIAQLLASLPKDVAQANSVPHQKGNAETVGSVPSAPQIVIRLSRATVTSQKNELVVSFDEGLFLSRAALKPEAERLLAELGKQLKPHASTILIRVVGFTDDITVPDGWIYRDNAALGMARAVIVAEYLRNNAGLPVSLFLLQSAGDSEAPYPNDTPGNRLRNRTAVLRIYPAQNAQEANP